MMSKRTSSKNRSQRPIPFFPTWVWFISDTFSFLWFLPRGFHVSQPQQSCGLSKHLNGKAANVFHRMYPPHSECKKVKETVGKPKAAGLPGAAGRNTELPAEDPRDRNRRRSKRHRGNLKFSKRRMVKHSTEYTYQSNPNGRWKFSLYRFHR